MITRAQYGTAAAGQEQAAGMGAQLVLLAAIGAAAGLGTLGWVVGTGFSLALWALLTPALRRSRKWSLGPADLVTLARSVLVGGVAALVADRFGEAQPIPLFATLAGIALALDAVDGQVARRTGTASALGARFDMEVDAFLILVLSVQVATVHGAWVLAIGALRYVFLAAAQALPWLGKALPASYGRKTIAALQGVVLLVVISGVLPFTAATAATAAALAALVWSFGRDTAWLARRHREAQLAQSQSRRLNSTYNAPAMTRMASVDTANPHHSSNPG